jgi:thioredoxin-related protein
MLRIQAHQFGIFAFLFLVAGDQSASGQEIRWRHDYLAARREAAETGRPLLLDFGTEACFWCKKLDATTFRDAQVIKVITDRYVPVKVDGNQNLALTQSLGIDSYPTLILATPEGKIFGRHSGYADRATLLSLLAKVPAAPPARSAPAASSPPDSDRLQRMKQQIDADLATLYRVIVAELDR